MCELSGCDLLYESGLHLSLPKFKGEGFKARVCGYAHGTAMTSGVFIHAMSLLPSVSFRKPA